jgi:hypothetical protein
VKVLNDPRTVLNKAPTNSFVISNAAGASPVFQGVKVKYLPEAAARIGGENAFTVLAPGESVTIEHDREYSSVYSVGGPELTNLQSRKLTTSRLLVPAHTRLSHQISFTLSARTTLSPRYTPRSRMLTFRQFPGSSLLHAHKLPSALPIMDARRLSSRSCSQRHLLPTHTQRRPRATPLLISHRPPATPPGLAPTPRRVTRL